jgi:hypothetical protein
VLQDWRLPKQLLEGSGLSAAITKTTRPTSMKKNLLFSVTLALAGSLLAAEPGPKDDVLAAVTKLGDQPNYSWKSTIVVPEGSRFRPGPTEGKTEKNGFTELAMSFGDRNVQAFLKDNKGAVSNRDGGWQSLADLKNSEGAARFLAGILENFKTPAMQAAELVASTKELKKEGDSYSGELSKEGAETLLTFRGRAGGNDGPTVSNATGSIKFWLKDGAVSKFETKASGKVSFGGNDRDVDRTTTVEIKDVGTTKVDVPEAAKNKLS